MAKSFKNAAEAKAAIVPLYRAGKIQCWSYGGRSKVTVSVFLGGGWCQLTDDLFAKLAA